MEKRFLRLKAASEASGVSLSELRQIYRTPGQTVIRKITPSSTNSPLIVDMTRLYPWLDRKIEETAPLHRTGRVV